MGRIWVLQLQSKSVSEDISKVSEMIFKQVLSSTATSDRWDQTMNWITDGETEQRDRLLKFFSSIYLVVHVLNILYKMAL